MARWQTLKSNQGTMGAAVMLSMQDGNAVGGADLHTAAHCTPDDVRDEIHEICRLVDRRVLRQACDDVADARQELQGNHRLDDAVVTPAATQRIRGHEATGVEQMLHVLISM